jgi:hypothetical protein
VAGRLSDETRAAFPDMKVIDVPAETLIYGDIADESHLLGEFGADPEPRTARRVDEPDPGRIRVGSSRGSRAVLHRCSRAPFAVFCFMSPALGLMYGGTGSRSRRSRGALHQSPGRG